MILVDQHLSVSLVLFPRLFPWASGAVPHYCVVKSSCSRRQATGESRTPLEWTGPLGTLGMVAAWSSSAFLGLLLLPGCDEAAGCLESRGKGPLSPAPGGSRLPGCIVGASWLLPEQARVPVGNFAGAKGVGCPGGVPGVECDYFRSLGGNGLHQPGGPASLDFLGRRGALDFDGASGTASRQPQERPVPITEFTKGRWNPLRGAGWCCVSFQGGA